MEREGFTPASKCNHRILCPISQRCLDASSLENFYIKYKDTGTSEPTPVKTCNNKDVGRFKFKIATEVKRDEIQSSNSTEI